MATEIIMPRLTDTMHVGMISYWYKKEGETVQNGEPLFVVETDKASVEVEASGSGILLKSLRRKGNPLLSGGGLQLLEKWGRTSPRC